MSKYIVFSVLLAVIAYLCIDLRRIRSELAYEKISSERAISEINGEWLRNQNTIDRQFRFIQELSKDCGEKELKRGLTEEDLMGR